ncbi:response regulator transcription factor [Galbibacter sp. EGI 63066]|uniref:response regulator transcription factor n=1 Tax=Galbibacter sp. EGI 63066 TaxID=2993559 RepID=UPI0022490434|nr:response regulator transcription factor [Galbibacter sp. EGI 63066]MCX2679899.1 response regulator transcription factor [Galbibacter sp. EGI 63066]
MTRNKLLLVEDDNSLGYLLSEYLKMKNFHLEWATNGVKALEVLKQEAFDLIIMDVMMPEMDGFTLAGKVRDLYPSIPFIFLTARSLKIDVLKGFSLGAVDYLKKPIDEEELVVRIETLLSRLQSGNEEVTAENYQIGGYSFSRKNQKLQYGDETITLTSRESELLLFLWRNKNELSLHKDILTHIWGKNDYFNRKSLNVFISHLRKYLSKDPRISIENVHNKGFVFKIEE